MMTSSFTSATVLNKKGTATINNNPDNINTISIATEIGDCFGRSRNKAMIYHPNLIINNEKAAITENNIPMASSLAGLKTNILLGRSTNEAFSTSFAAAILLPDAIYQ